MALASQETENGNAAAGILNIESLDAEMVSFCEMTGPPGEVVPIFDIMTTTCVVTWWGTRVPGYQGIVVTRSHVHRQH